MKNLRIIFFMTSVLFLTSNAFAEVAYYPLICIITGDTTAGSPQMQQTVVSFSTKTINVGGTNVNVQVANASFTLKNIPCSWELGRPDSAPRGTSLPQQMYQPVSSFTINYAQMYYNKSVEPSTYVAGSGWGIPMNQKFRLFVTIDPTMPGRIKEGTTYQKVP